MNSAAMYTSFGKLMDIFLQIYIIYLEEQDHWEYKYPALVDTAEQFFQVDQFITLPAVCEFPLLHTLANTWNFLVLFLAILEGGMYHTLKKIAYFQKISRLTEKLRR